MNFLIRCENAAIVLYFALPKVIVNRGPSEPSQRSMIRTITCEITPDSAHFCNSSSLHSPQLVDFADARAFLSRPYRQNRDPAQHHPELPTVVLPAAASGSGHASPVDPVFTSLCCKLVSDQFSIRFGSDSLGQRFPKLYSSRPNSRTKHAGAEPSTLETAPRILSRDALLKGAGRSGTRLFLITPSDRSRVLT